MCPARSRITLIALIGCLLVAALLLTACGSGSSDPFVASKMSTKFHKASCAWAAQIHSESKVTFKTREEAIKAGYEPDPTCNP
jgi:hypothetical protein